MVKVEAALEEGEGWHRPEPSLGGALGAQQMNLNVKIKEIYLMNDMVTLFMAAGWEQVEGEVRGSKWHQFKHELVVT